MLENSLSDGALYSFRDPGPATGDDDAMMNLLIDFWAAVREIFA